MNCRDFELLLPDLVARGSLDGASADQTEALRHSATCDRCARLLAVSRGELDLLEDAEAEVSLQAILQRTTGEACTAAESRLPAWADGLLQVGDADLLAGHVAHCPNCRALAGALVTLREELPSLAEVDPGADFAGSVLARTSRSADSAQRPTVRTPAERGSVRPTGPSLLDDIREAGSAWGRYWAAVMRRPRAVLELAYGASLIVCLVIGSPGARFRDVSSEVTALVSRVPTPRLVVASVVPDGWEGAAGGPRALIDKAIARAEERAPRGIVARLVRAWKRAAVTAAAARDHGPVLGQALLRLDLVTAWKEAEFIRQAGKKESEPADPAVRPANDRGMASPGGDGDGPAASKGGTS
jgi:anti-sigma factor ChrR (cupin superfamily)